MTTVVGFIIHEQDERGPGGRSQWCEMRVRGRGRGLFGHLLKKKLNLFAMRVDGFNNLTRFNAHECEDFVANLNSRTSGDQIICFC